MDRLFGKLGLGEIKVGESSSFPPDAEPYAEGDVAGQAVGEPVAAPVAQAAHPQASEPAHTINGASNAGAPVGGHVNGYAGHVEAEDHVVGVAPRAYRPGYGQGVPEQRGEVLKVSSRSRPSAVAGAIAGVVRENGRAEVQAIGAGAANQAIKAVAIARDYLNETGINVVCLPSLVDLQIDEADRTAIRLVVETR